MNCTDNIERIYVIKNKIMAHFISGVDIILEEYNNEEEANKSIFDFNKIYRKEFLTEGEQSYE